MNRISELAQIINAANDAYYRPGSTSIIPDATYDALIQELRELSPNHPLLSIVGPSYDHKSLRNKVEHRIAMGSLDNTDNGIVGFVPWISSIKNKLCQEISIVASLKIDGASICVRYESGKLVQIASRGNGTVGEDLTANGVKFGYFLNGEINQSSKYKIPIELPEKITCDIRGEAILFNEDFKEICLKDGIEEDEISNARNVGNGMLGRDNGAGCEYIKFFAFNIFMKSKTYGSEVEKLTHLESLGFTTVSSKHCKIEEIQQYYDDIVEKRDKLDYNIDGIVVAINDTNQQRILNESSRSSKLRPKHARAIKFPHKSAITTLLNVSLSVGHTRAIIPTAILKKVKIGGVNVTHALLNNFDEIKRLDIAIGDDVEVILAGDIIPKIIRKAKDGVNRQKIMESKRCPSCGSDTTRNIRHTNGAVTYCVNKKCPAALREKIDHWIGTSKKGVGILGIGDNILSALWASGRLNDAADLYSLNVAMLEDLELESGVRIGKSRACLIVDEIQSKKHLTLPVFLGSLGIELLGRRRVEQLQEKSNGQLDELDNWLDGRISTIEVEGLGDSIRQAILSGIDENRELIYKLLDNGVSIVKGLKVKMGKFDGISCCWTGTRECLAEFTAMGGIVKNGVSKQLDYLVQEDLLSKSSKTMKADKYGVNVISVDYMRKAIAGEVQLEKRS